MQFIIRLRNIEPFSCAQSIIGGGILPCPTIDVVMNSYSDCSNLDIAGLIAFSLIRDWALTMSI